MASRGQAPSQLPEGCAPSSAIPCLPFLPPPGNMEGAKIYAQNAIRKKSEALNYLKLASRLDAVVSRLDTQAKMQVGWPGEAVCTSSAQDTACAEAGHPWLQCVHARMRWPAEGQPTAAGGCGNGDEDLFLNRNRHGWVWRLGEGSAWGVQRLGAAGWARRWQEWLVGLVFLFELFYCALKFTS